MHIASAIKIGADPKTSEPLSNYTALKKACACEDMPLVIFLLKHVSDPDSFLKEGVQAVQGSEHKHMVRFLERYLVTQELKGK